MKIENNFQIYFIPYNQHPIFTNVTTIPHHYTSCSPNHLLCLQTNCLCSLIIAIIPHYHRLCLPIYRLCSPIVAIVPFAIAITSSIVVHCIVHHHHCIAHHHHCIAHQLPMLARQLSMQHIKCSPSINHIPPTFFQPLSSTQ